MACSSRQTKHFSRNTNNICSLLNNASIGTFCVQIGQLLESHWIFGELRFDLASILLQKRLNIVFNQFGRKMYQQKLYLMRSKRYWGFFEKYFVQNELQAAKFFYHKTA